ncbi:hypothetical protein KI387_022023, partial [Taxus chinensis]
VAQRKHRGPITHRSQDRSRVVKVRRLEEKTQGSTTAALPRRQQIFQDSGQYGSFLGQKAFLSGE